ncbi:hypothetical protein MA03_07000 [Infirmifilum uzonense]|uniref:Uncharacterized protein n=1 Tax=Infirmifilum uzonense TaxID=1550241 RepID=A0A0F7FI75_9CREN|nr:hypothetical protein [Infirmifilum uzonense]AKG39037.1 hypothetical protein MA03_07000 [Infirmifilum uzonense]
MARSGLGSGLIGRTISSRASSPGLSPLYSFFFLEEDVGAIQAFQVNHARRAWYALSEAVEEVNIRRTRIASLRIYAAIPPDYRKTLDSIEAMLRELEEHRDTLESILEE